MGPIRILKGPTRSLQYKMYVLDPLNGGLAVARFAILVTIKVLDLLGGDRHLMGPNRLLKGRTRSLRYKTYGVFDPQC